MPLTIMSTTELRTPPKDEPFVPGGVPRDGHDRPVVVPEEGGKPIALTRMTTRIGSLEEKSNLERYYKRMVLRGASFMQAELNQVRRLDPDDPKDKRELNRLAAKAEELSGANDKRERGTWLHGLSEHVDRGEELPAAASESDHRDMAAYKAATAMLKVIHIEELTVCRALTASGTPDRVCFYDGLDPDGEPAGNLITDLKTGSVEWGELKMAMQLAGYSRSKFYDHRRFIVPGYDDEQDRAKRLAALSKWKTRTTFSAEEAAAAYTDLPNVNQRWGLIMNLPAGTGVCTVYWIDLTKGWKAALLADQVHEVRKTKVLQPFAA
ncbi:hypothetical protein [Actinoplanes sp. NPDC026670]|uniref:hypothetical protein n=1 Tax=Actinoplanes sp. NPDC026670 TaxID=3154700 RepID=UPI0033F9E75B